VSSTRTARMRALQQQLVAAIDAGDDAAVKALGWEPVWRALNTWWAPRQTASIRDLRRYAELLGAQPPDSILTVLVELAGDWQPHPAAILGQIRSVDDRRINPGRGGDPAATPAALAAARAARTAGEPLCNCGRHRSTVRIDAGVLRCLVCGGLEHGQ